MIWLVFSQNRVLRGDELADAQQKHAKYYSKVVSQAGNLYEKGGTNLLAGLDLFDREWANIKIRTNLGEK